MLIYIVLGLKLFYTIVCLLLIMLVATILNKEFKTKTKQKVTP